MYRYVRNVCTYVFPTRAECSTFEYMRNASTMQRHMHALLRNEHCCMLDFKPLLDIHSASNHVHAVIYVIGANHMVHAFKG